MITKTHTDISMVLSRNGGVLQGEHRKTVAYAIAAYGYLLPIGEHSYQFLADKIGRYYNPKVARNKACIEALELAQALLG